MLFRWGCRRRGADDRACADDACLRGRLARGAAALQAVRAPSDVGRLGGRAARGRGDRSRGARQRLPRRDRRGGGHRRAQRGAPAARRRDPAAADARSRLPARARARRVDAARRRRPHQRGPERRRVLVGAARRPRRVGRDARAPGRPRRRRRHAVLVPRRPPDRAAKRRADPDRRARDRLPRDRRARAPHPAPRDARRQRAAHGPVGRRGRLPADRLGDRSLVADRREPGRDPARLERRHPRVPLGREGDRDGDDLLGARRLRRARAAARDRQGPAAERRREPRQPPLGPGRRRDPHRQPDRGREEGEPGLPDVLRERLQRDAGARPVRLGGDPRVDGRAPRDPPRRPAARAPRRQLPVHARRACASSSAT